MAARSCAAPASSSTPSKMTFQISSSRRPSLLAQSDSARVLVVEDDPAVRELLRISLESVGYHVALAEHGLDALMQIDRAQPKPNLLLVDIMIPELDGLSLVRALKGRPETARIPVVFI